MAKTGNERECDETGAPVGLWERSRASKRAKRFIRRFLKGFGSGLCLYTGFQIVTALLRQPYIKRFSNIRTGFVGSDSLRFATFLGLYPGVYELVIDVMEQVGQKTDDWNSALAGGIAGLSLVIEHPRRRRFYCLFAIARAVGAFVSTLVKRGFLPEVPFSETFLLSCCTSFVIYCFILKPQYLLGGYYRSIQKWSRHYTEKNMSVLYRQPSDKFVTCAEAGFHQHGCTRYAVTDFVQSLPDFAKLYFTIYLVPTVLFKYRRLYKRPKRVLQSMLHNIFWSTMCLATMVTASKYTICLFRNLQHRPPPLSPWIAIAAGFSLGLGILLERRNRRKELTMFVIPHTLYAIYLASQETRLAPHIPYGTVALFAIAMVPIMHAYEREPESLTRWIHSTLRFFIGKRNHTVELPPSKGAT